MQPLADKALKALEDGELRIIPDRFEKVLSRSHPFFYDQDYWMRELFVFDEEFVRAQSISDMIQWHDRHSNMLCLWHQIYNFWLSNIKDWCVSRQLWWGHRIPVWYVEGSDESDYIVARSEEDAYKAARAKHGEDVKLTQESDVLDTWFSRYGLLIWCLIEFFVRQFRQTSIIYYRKGNRNECL